jgi:FkbM family methyltransferase
MVTRAERIKALLVNSRRADRITMNMRKYTHYRPNWNWKGMAGSAACIKWCFRDLENLDTALSLFNGRTLAIQAGGNIGIFAKRLAEEFNVVHTFEPDDKLFSQMSINVTEENVVMHKSALGDSHEGVSMRCVRRDTSGRDVHEGLTHVHGKGDTQQLMIDDFNFPVCDLIYLDIEGYELKALRGAVDTIARCRPVIAVEINGAAAHYGYSRADISDFFQSRNYVLRVERNSDAIYAPWELGR